MRGGASEFSSGFSSPGEIFSWLEGFSNFEKKGFSLRSFRLDRMERLLEIFGRPDKACPCLHVAGSKGKGSTAAFLASILKEAGFRTGLYTSPHLVSYKERITLAGEEIPDEVFLSCAEKLKAGTQGLDAGHFPGGEFPTTFELLTCLAFLVFRELDCHWLVLETGMGGRLDATNVVMPRASVMTPIELEHSEYLGETVAAIAGEKAGIIKDGVPVFSAAQSGEALEVFRSRCRETGSPFFYLPEHFERVSSRTRISGTEAEFIRPGTGESFSPTLRLLGEVQAENAALAFLVMASLLPELSPGLIMRGLEQAFIPGRFQRIEAVPPVFVDGSHTPLSVRRLLRSLCELYPKPDTLVLGVVAGKRYAEIAEILCPAFRCVIVTRPGTFKASNPEELYETCRKYTANARLIHSAPEALDAAKNGILRLSGASERAILVTGSFYLAGEILANTPSL